MDEWSSSVWDTPFSTVIPKDPTELRPPTLLDPLEQRPGQEIPQSLEDFGDFGESLQKDAVDDDFGNDFGEFGDGQGESVDFDFDGDMGKVLAADQVHREPVSQGPPEWDPLRLDPMPPPPRLAAEVQEILLPLWRQLNSEEVMTRENIRQVEGSGQILVTQDSQTLHRILFNDSPTATTWTPNWTRSRIRRQHLISLGIPINLDEMMPQANGKSLPMLNITTRPSSAPPGPRSTSPTGSVTRSGTPQPSVPSAAKHSQSPLSSLGPKPKLDSAKVAEVLGLNADTLPLLPLATLETHLHTLRSLTQDASSLLSYLLQTREALQQDSETYNGLIAGLVGEAQKMKSGPKSRANTGRRGSGIS